MKTGKDSSVTIQTRDGGGLDEEVQVKVDLMYLELSSLWTVACQASLSMGFSRQEYWNRLSCPPPGDLPGSGIKPRSPDGRQILYDLSHQTCLPTTMCRARPVGSWVTVHGHTNSC